MTLTALDAARHAATACGHGFDEAYLRIWFRDTLGGTIAPGPGVIRLEAFGVACPGRPGFLNALADWAEFTLATKAHDPLAAFLHLIAPRDQWARAGLIEAAVIATGGTWVRPPARPGEWSGSHLYEITLFGVLGRGSDPVAASADWIKAASRMIRPEAA